MHAEPSAGTCFGFAVHSSLPFEYLRGGSGQPLEITAPTPEEREDGELVAEWTPTATNPLHGRLLRSEGGYRLWTAGAGWFSINPQRSTITLPAMADAVRREEHLWAIPAMLCLLARGDVPLHAAAVEVDGRAIVIGAPRASGKTTLSAALLDAGYRLLSEDVTCVRPGVRPSVIPGPAMLRVRRDIADRLEIRHATPLGEPDDRVHFAVDRELRGDSAPVSLGAIVLLRPSDGAPRLDELAPREAIRDLWPLASRLPSRAGLARSFEDLVDVAGRVPIWNLRRRLRIDDLPATIEALVRVAT